MISNIIWDVDGTLFNTFPAITYALSKALNRMGKPVALNLIDGLVRQSFQHCVDTLGRRYKVDADVLMEQFSQIYCTVSPQNQRPVDGVCEVCQWIIAHGGQNAAVIYRDERDVQRLFAVHAVGSCFSGVHGLAPGEVPDPVETALQEDHLRPEETLVVGSRLLILQTGRDAGCQTCLIGDEVPAGQADMQVDNARQLLDRLLTQQG